jgi:hypothetical protein
MGIPVDDEPLPTTDDEPVGATPAAPEAPADMEAPQADAADQNAEVVAGWHVGRVTRDIEVSEADAIDQALELPEDDGLDD